MSCASSDQVSDEVPFPPRPLRIEAAHAAARLLDAIEEQARVARSGIPHGDVAAIGGEERRPAFADQAAADDRYRFRLPVHDLPSLAADRQPRSGWRR